MLFQTLGLMTLLFSSLALANGRKPAVEDFVGIEVEHAVETAPQGTEALFNFEKDINDFEASQAEVRNSTSITIVTPAQNLISWNTIFGIVLILGLPLVSWIGVMSHLRRKASEASAPNIKVFEQYRKEREAARKTEDIKKAS